MLLLVMVMFLWNYGYKVSLILRVSGCIAESCTGGLLSHMISKYPGSSSFKGTIVSYSNEIKNSILQVPKDILMGMELFQNKRLRKC